MDKELMLIFEYNKAPDELKAAAKEHQQNLIKMKKALANAEKQSKELAELQKASESSGKRFRLALKAWEPKGEA